MCIVKTPAKIAAKTASDTALPVLRNPFLDGLDPILRSRSTGVRSLRIDRGVKPVRPPAVAPAGLPPGSIGPAYTLPPGSLSSLSINR